MFKRLMINKIAKTRELTQNKQQRCRILRRMSLQEQGKGSKEFADELFQIRNINVSTQTLRRRLVDIGVDSEPDINTACLQCRK